MKLIHSATHNFVYIYLHLPYRSVRANEEPYTTPNLFKTFIANIVNNNNNNNNICFYFEL